MEVAGPLGTPLGLAHTNILIIRIPEEEERKKGYGKIFEAIIVENFPNMEKEILKSHGSYKVTMLYLEGSAFVLTFGPGWSGA